MSRSFESSIMILAAAAMTACSDDNSLAPVRPSAARVVSDVVAPSSVGWQEQARTLAAGANMSPQRRVARVRGVGRSSIPRGGRDGRCRY
jgi:hypothetical protein